MSTALSWGLPEIHPESSDPVARCEADQASVATAVAGPDSLRLLVAADVGRYSLMIAHTFRRAVGEGASLGRIADRLDEAVTRVSMDSICATLVDVTPDGFTVLHRGGPTPVVVRADGSLTRVVPALPGAPLGPHESTSSNGPGELVPAAPQDALLVTTPGSVEPAIRAMAAAEAPTFDALWQALAEMGATAEGSAYALVGRPTT
jgi:Stage II sporulation protein E (SpoIIE)